MSLLLIKTSLCILGAGLCIASLRWEWWKNLKLSHLVLIGFGWRFLLLGTWFVFLGGHVSGDVQGYDLHTQWVLDGKVPNRDFDTPYGFYLNYFNALIYQLYGNPIILVLCYQLLELLGVILLSRLISHEYGTLNGRLFIVLYCFNPIVISWFALDGQEELLLIPLIALIVWAHGKARPVVSAAVAALMVLLVKVTSVTLWLPFILYKRSEGVMLTLLLAGLLMVPGLWMGSDIFSTDFSRGEGAGDVLLKRIFPGNAWFVTEMFTGRSDFGSLPVVTLALLMSLTASFIFISKINERQLPSVAAAAVALCLGFQLVSPYTSPGFLAITVPFILISILGESTQLLAVVSRIKLFVLWSLIVCLDMPVYFRFLSEIDSYQLTLTTFGSSLGDILLLWQVVIVALNLVFFLLTLGYVQSGRFQLPSLTAFKS
jgi:hypothetical protein